MEGGHPGMNAAATTAAIQQTSATARAAALLAGGAAKAQPMTSQQRQQQQSDGASDPSSAGEGAAADTDADYPMQNGDGADLDTAPIKQQAAARGSGRPAAVYKEGSTSDDSAEDGSGDEDSPQEQTGRQQRGSRGAPRQQQQQWQGEEEPAGRPRRAAALAASDRMRSAEAAGQQQEQTVRRSSRVRRAVPMDSPVESDEDLPVARPRRAAAAAAKQATAAALAAEAATWASQPDSESDLGSPDPSDVEDAVGASSEDDAAGLSGSEGSDDEGGMDGSGDNGSWGTGKKQRQRAQPKRSRVNRAAAVDDSEEPDSEADREADGSPGGDQPMDLSAFAFNGNAAQAPAPAAAGGRGQGTRRGSNGSGSGGSREASEEPDAAQLAAALEAEEVLRGDVLDPSEFAPQQLAKLPRGEDVDKCVDVRYGEDDSVNVLVKLVGRCYRQAVWLPAAVIEAKRPSLLRNFLSRHAGGDIDTDWADTNNIDPAWYRIDRIVSEHKYPRQPSEFLVKWCGLEYSETTWEKEEEICRDGAGQVALARFRRWSTLPRTKPVASKRPRQELLDQKLLPAFKNGRKLRDYQEESLHWMVNNYRGQIVSGRWKPRNCILGDEMGLGKTAQSIAVISWLKQFAGAAAPCMVVAPLTTLGHWKREIETWTDLNVVLYAGSAEDRRLIRDYEFHYPGKKGWGARFNVLLSSYETVLKDKGELRKLQFEALIVDEAHRLKNQKSATRLALQEMSVRWLLMLSGTPVQNNMKELQGLMSLLDQDAYGDTDDFMEQYGSDQPSLEQIRALQAALAPVLLRRMKEDVEDLPEKEEVVIWVELTAEQRRYYRALYSQQIGALLGGGNKNLPNMRNLAMELRKLCCHPFLCDGLEDDMTLKWAEAQAAAGAKTQKEIEIENYTRASGKMLLLHKLLPKLRAEGRQVLIFSQFKMMLDVIEDYLTASEYPFERIDGDTKHTARQAAIDRFMAVQDRQRSKTPTSRAATPSAADAGADSGQGDAAAAAAGGGKSGEQSAGNSRAPSPLAANDEADGADGPFVFLLSTRAGGQGITLTSADTVILYDSDWNPQNDLQAMARCHRIGQKKEVMVYRLVSKNTYEQQLFECSSRKMGLDEAILGFAGSGENPENDAARIEQLLRLGAHAILGGGEGGAAGGDAAGEDKGFAGEDIDQILTGRSEKRQLGNRKGNTFSIAHFGDGGGELEVELEPEPQQEEAQVAAKDAKTFWAELLPEAAAEHAARAKSKQIELLGPRRRTRVDYREANVGARADVSSDMSDASYDDDEDGDSHGSKGLKRGAEVDVQQQLLGAKKQKKKGDEPMVDAELGRVVQPWKASQVEPVRDALLRYGADRIDKVIAQSLEAPGLQFRQADEVRQLCRALLSLLDEAARIAPILQQEEKAAKDALTAAAASGDAAQVAQARISHGNLSSHYVNSLRDRLVSSGLEHKLPPACSKALMSLDTVRKMGRAPAAMQQQLLDHHKVHQAMVAAGLVKGSKVAAGSSQQQQQEGSQPAAAATAPAAAAAAAAGSSAPNGDAPKRVWVAPRVLLRGSKGMPAWWKREHDDLLLQGCYAHGYASGAKLTTIVEDILRDPRYAFNNRLCVDPIEQLREQTELATPRPPPTYVEVQVTQPDNTVRTERRLVAPPPVKLDPQQLAVAQQQKQQLQQAHPGIELQSPLEWRRLVAAIVQRLKRVRGCLLDPTYVEPATPSKQLHMPNNVPPAAAAAGAAAPAAAAASGGGSVQQRLQLTPAGDGSMLYKGRKVIGGGLPSAAGPAAAGTPAAAAGAARTPPAFGRPQMQVLSPAQQQQLMANQRAVAQQNMASLVNAVRTVATLQAVSAAAQAQMQARKRQADEQGGSASKRPHSNGPSPVAAQPPAMLTPQAIMAQAAEAARQARLQEQRRLLDQQQHQQQALRQLQQQQLQQQLQQQQQQKRQHEVVELLDDDDSDGEKPAPAAAPAAGKHTNPAAAGTPAAAPAAVPAPPSSGLTVRRVPAGNDLSQEQSVDEPAGAQGAAGADVSSSGKQHMQQLLGDSDAKAASSAPAKGTGSKAAAEHPVYGTPAGAAAPAAAAAAGAGSRRKGKDDPKQRKLDSFFAVSK